MVIPTKNISNLEAPELSHLYFSILKKGGVNNYGNLVEDSILDKDFGENMFQNISWKNQGKNRNCVKIQLLNISIENNLFVDENKTIYDSCY